MNILITGANGFIGSHLVQTLLNAGYNITACVRNTNSVQRRWPEINHVESDFNRDLDPSVWFHRLVGIDIVINAVGIINETRNQRFCNLHTRAPCALFQACERAETKLVIQISALGADDAAFSHYHLSKREADQCLMSLKLNWVILMPSIVYGPGANSMVFFRSLAVLPFIPLVGRGDQAIQPIHIDDFSKATVRLIKTNPPKRLKIEMVGPDQVTMREMYTRLRQWFGIGKALFIHLPYRFAVYAGYVAGLFWNTPMTAETVKMLEKGNTGDVKPFIRQFGFKPVSLDESLKNTPPQLTDLWAAKLYFLKPLLRLSIAFVWIFTGIISATVVPVEQSYTMLEKAGISGDWAPITLYGAAAVDIALGIATLFSYRISIVGLFQIGVILLYTLIITFTQAEQWLHPFGPVSKNIPLLASTMILITLHRKL